MKKNVILAATLGLLLVGNGAYAGSKIADVDNSQFKEAIYNVVDKGYMGFVDKNSNFAPKQQVTRGQLAQILTNFETKVEDRITTDFKGKLAELEAIKKQQAVEVKETQKESSTELTIVGNTMKSVVKVKDGTASGSGVFIDERTILTAYHVVDKGNTTVSIQLSDYKNPIKGTIETIDQWQDLAIIKIDDTLEKDNYKVRPISLATTDIKLGESVYAFGNPKGVDFTVTKGIISNTHQVVAVRGMYQFDAPVHPGNSGGPLVNEKGQLIGIVNSVLGDDNDKPYYGISFATKLEAIKGFLKQPQ